LAIVTGLDKYEQHADAVAAKVASGESAGSLLEEYAGNETAVNVQAQASQVLQQKGIVKNEEHKIQSKVSQVQDEKGNNLDLSNTDNLLAAQGSTGNRRPASFSYKNISGPTNLGCGGFDWRVQWEVENQMPREFGFVVQRIRAHLQNTPCQSPNSQAPQIITYWEAWPVKDDTVYQNLSRASHTYDKFSVEPAPNHYGINGVEGHAKYIPNYREPASWGASVDQAGDLLSTTSEPAGWSDVGAIVRHVVNDFILLWRRSKKRFEGGKWSNLPRRPKKNRKWRFL
jgi:hypothetical protein